MVGLWQNPRSYSMAVNYSGQAIVSVGKSFGWNLECVRLQFPLQSHKALSSIAFAD
jgi:hypothetical protein